MIRFHPSRAPRPALPCMLLVALTLVAAGHRARAVGTADDSPSPEHPPIELIEHAFASGSDDDSASWRVVINVPEFTLRVYRRYVSANNYDSWSCVRSWPVAVGTRRYRTPLLEAPLGRVIVRPDWAAPNVAWAGEHAGTIVRFLHPENPFRTRGANGRWEGYFLPIGHSGIGIHTTNQPRSIGKAVSHGCIRMRLGDIRELKELVPAGTQVKTVYELHRIEVSEDSITIHSFPDIYRRFRDSERRAALLEALNGAGVAPEQIAEGLIHRMLRPGSVSVTRVLSISYADWAAEEPPRHTGSGSREHRESINVLDLTQIKTP